MESDKKKNPNRLFRALIIISIGIHVLIFMYISGIYRSRALSVIELSLIDVSKPVTRNVPRPRLRPRETPEIKDPKRLSVRQRPFPSVKPMRLAPAQQDLPDSLMEKIAIPNIPAFSEPQVESWVPPAPVGGTEAYVTAGDCLEMVKVKIEGQKQYPEEARTRHIEGRVSVRFIITPEGHIGSAEITGKSGSLLLDEAALKAVKAASPFPRPPERFFKGGVALTVTVVFDLM